MKRIQIAIKNVGQPLKLKYIYPVINNFRKLLNAENYVINPFVCTPFDINVLVPDSINGQKHKFNCKINNIDLYGNLIFISEDVLGEVTSLNDSQFKTIKALINS